MKEYFGIIMIGKIKNKQVGPSAKPEDSSGFIDMNESNIRFVHYPDCQQILIWLTHPGREYGNVRLRNKKDKKLVEEWPVTERLNGSIQIIWNTLPFSPGSYTIEIDWKNGWQHHVDIEKYEEGVVPTIKQSDAPAKKIKKEKTEEPVEYRDGFGNIIKNEDVILREKLKKDIAQKFSRRIEYEGNFRAGTIIYYDSDTRIEFYHEMGGGNCMFYIDIPTDEQWEARTKTSLSARKEILEFVATTVRAQQASNCNYEIKNDTIVFYYK